MRSRSQPGMPHKKAYSGCFQYELPSDHPLPPSWPRACMGACPSQGLPLTFCTYSPLPWHSWSLFLLTSSHRFEKTVVLSLQGAGGCHTAYF